MIVQETFDINRGILGCLDKVRLDNLILMFLYLKSQLKLSMNMLVLSLRQQSQMQQGRMLTQGWRQSWRECLISMWVSLSLA